MCRTTTTTTTMKSSTQKICQSKTVNAVKKNRKAKKRVSFSGSDKVAFRHVLKEELEQSWYNSNEYKGFQFDRLRTIQTLRQARGDLTALDPNSQCVRGPEMQATPEIYRFRSNGIKSTIRQVLNQQQVQRIHGLKDDASLGLVSMVYSSQARNLATALAAIDSQQRNC